MDQQNDQDITGLLKRWSGGEQAALDELMPLVFNDLRRIARRQVSRERAKQSLEATALVHEVYQRLVDAARVDWKDRAHFFALCSRMLRRILVDLARERERRPWAHEGRQISPEDVLQLKVENDSTIVALDEALAEMEKQFPRQCRVVELRCFGGLSVEETAAVLGYSVDTIYKDWKFARAWLKAAMAKE